MINRKGFSLIEVIICIAIMGILSVSAFSLSGHLKYADVKRCAKEINQEIETARMTTMTKSGDWQLYIYKLDDGVYYYLSKGTTSDLSKGEKVGSSKIRLFYTLSGVETEVKSGDSPIHINFVRSTGRFNNSEGALFYDSIRIAGQDSDGEKIKLVKMTGKHYFED